MPPLYDPEGMQAPGSCWSRVKPDNRGERVAEVGLHQGVAVALDDHLRLFLAFWAGFFLAVGLSLGLSTGAGGAGVRFRISVLTDVDPFDQQSRSRAAIGYRSGPVGGCGRLHKPDHYHVVTMVFIGGNNAWGGVF